jgi:hypothetical protein
VVVALVVAVGSAAVAGCGVSRERDAREVPDAEIVAPGAEPG